MNKIEYLKKYSSDVSFVDFTFLPEEIKKTLPLYWNSLLSATDPAIKNKILIDEWEKYKYQYQSTLSYLKNNLSAVDLICTNNKYSLLYSLKNKAGEIVFYEGKNPLTKVLPDNIALIWERIPKTFTDVYDHLHNGWVYFASQANGVLPIEDVIILADMDWGILEDIEASSLPFRLENCVGFFHNGHGDYASLDVESTNQKLGFIWWHAKSPKLNIEIWPVIDEWTKIGMEQ